MKFNIIKNDYKISQDIVKHLEETLKKKGWILDEKEPNLVFIIGGDGTFLKAVSTYNNKLDNIIFLPFKTGGIGFYTNKNRIENVDIALKNFENNNYKTRNYELLEIKNNGNVYYATNEVKILNERQAVYIEIFINNQFLEKFHGTGLVVSTSNGSTGYMKSTGGAIVLPRTSKIYQLQELMPVSTNKFRTLNSPLILNSDYKVTLKLEKSSKETLIIDTQELPIIDKEIKISVANQVVKVISDDEILKSDIEVLRDIFIKDKEEIK